MPDPRDYKLDIAGLDPADASADHADDAPASPGPKPYLGVNFACCGVYARIHKTPDGLAYRGHCPRCARPVHFRVGHGGTSSRFFVVE